MKHKAITPNQASVKEKKDPTKNLTLNPDSQNTQLMTSNAISQSDDDGTTRGDCFFVPEMSENSSSVRIAIPSAMPTGKEP